MRSGARPYRGGCERPRNARASKDGLGAVNPNTLSGDFLRTLLDKINRPLTLKEVTQQFYKNAAFPMVPATDDIRRAVFQTLRGPHPYEIVGGRGEALTITSPDDLSLGSMDLVLRKASPAASTPSTTGSTKPGPGTGPVQPGAGGGSVPGGGSEHPPAPHYQVYRLEVPNRSLADPNLRAGTTRLLAALLDQVDPDYGGDIQVFEMSVTFTADPSVVSDILQRAAETNARWTFEEPDF